MKTSLLVRSIPFLAAPLLACSGGDDVYVTPESPSTQQSAGSTECIVAPGEDVCANLTKYSAETPAPATIDMIRSVVDFTLVAMSSASSVMHACGRILDDLHIQRPQGKQVGSQAGSPDWLADLSTVYCDAAATAIRVQGAGLKIDVAPPACTTAPDPAPACGSTATPFRERCEPPKVNVDAGPGASAERVALAHTLEKNLPSLLHAKSDLARLSSLTGTIASNAGSLTTLQASCTATFAQMASHSVRLTSSVATASANVVTAVQ